jgi:hypothetical protein
MKTKTKIVRVSLTVRLPYSFNYIAQEKDGVVWGFKSKPCLEYDGDIYGWKPDILDDCIPLVYGNIVPNANWSESLVCVENKKRRGVDHRIVLDIRVDKDAKYMFMPPPRTIGLVFASYNKPFMSEKYKKWLCIEHPAHVLTIRRLYDDWRSSLRMIGERNIVR